MRHFSEGSLFRSWLIATVLLVPAAVTRADDFEINVQVRPGDAKNEEAAAERTVQTKRPRLQPFGGKRKPRLVFRAKRGEMLWVRWKVKYVGEEGKLRNVLVHFFVDQEKKVGQKALPKLGKDVVHEGAVTLDFKPGDQAKGKFMLKIPRAGVYLLRVETQNLLGQHGHEHYAALDLAVE